MDSPTRVSSQPRVRPPSNDAASPITPPGQSSSGEACLGERVADGIIHFDATEARRNRLRGESARVLSPASVKMANPSPATNSDSSDALAPAPIASAAKLPMPTLPPSNATAPVATTFESTSQSGNAKIAAADPWWERVMRDYDDAPDAASSASTAPPAVAEPEMAPPSKNGHHHHSSEPVERPATSGQSSEDLRRFLVNFVVEQTGYPEEIVEMDADLEADLGIDSIKKAQMFGEIGEHFGLEPDDNISLDDFLTLDSVLAYLIVALAGEGKLAPSNGSADTDNIVDAILPVTPHSSSANQVNGVVSVTPSDDAVPSREELQTFLINFVVEQTGYPEEIVELDADLEADLGIDSIKKAQMFGEIGEYFSLQPDENMSLDEFTTLNDVLAYLETNLI